MPKARAGHAADEAVGCAHEALVLEGRVVGLRRRNPGKLQCYLNKRGERKPPYATMYGRETSNRAGWRLVMRGAKGTILLSCVEAKMVVDVWCWHYRSRLI